MARRERPRDPDRPAGEARLVEVRVIGEPDGHDGTQDSSGNGIVLATITALLVAALLVIVVTTVAGGEHRNAPAKPPRWPPLSRPPPSRPNTEPSHQPGGRARVGPASVAAVYGDPLGCLRVTIAPADPSYARVVYNRVSACRRNDGTITAIYHRVDGDWRPVLDAKAYACPIASRSRALASEPGVCPSALYFHHSRPAVGAI